MRIGKPSGEVGHDAFFAVNEESIFWPGLLMPGEQFRLIRMRRKSIDRMDFRSHRDFFAKDSHFPDAVDYLSRERSARGEADKYDGRIFAPKVMPQMMTDPPARAHSRSSHDDGTPLYLV